MGYLYILQDGVMKRQRFITSLQYTNGTLRVAFPFMQAIGWATYQHVTHFEIREA